MTALYDEREIAQVAARFPCMKCESVHARVVMEKVFAFLVARWEGRDVKPPSLAELRKFCCWGPLN
jgi:hypothetical protein